MPNAHGLPIWYEFVAKDADGADRFDGRVLGWRFSRRPADLGAAIASRRRRGWSSQA